MLSCKQVSQLVSQSFDRKLTLLERLKLKFHLVMCKCPFCKQSEPDMDHIRTVIKQRLEGEDQRSPEHQLSSEARDRIQKIVDSIS